jgi:hypothetical protein
LSQATGMPGRRATGPPAIRVAFHIEGVDGVSRGSDPNGARITDSFGSHGLARI